MPQLKTIWTLILLLVVLGGCTKYDYALQDAKYELLDGRPIYAVQFANQVIQENPENAEAYLVRAMGLSEIARQAKVEQREAIYQRMTSSLTMADSLYRRYDDKIGVERVDLERKNAWLNEFNAGSAIFNKDKTTFSRAELVSSSTHFSNAIYIEPDSGASYWLLASIHMNLQDYIKALELMEEAEQKDPDGVSNYRKLKAIALANVDRCSESVPILEELAQSSPKDVNVRTALHNCYQYLGLYQSADGELDVLAVLRPTDPAISLYQARKKTREIDSEIKSLLESDSSFILTGEQLYVRSVEDVLQNVQQAEYLYLKAYRDSDENSDYAYPRGLFYFNLASMYKQFSEILEDPKDISNFQDIAREHYTNAIAPLKRSFGGQAEEKLVWNMLYQSYSYLGRKHDAALALRNLNALIDEI